MRKLHLAATALALSACMLFAGCSTTNNAATVVADKQPSTVAEYFDTYETTMWTSAEKGYVYVLDDGTEYGLGLAVTLTDDQMAAIDDLDFFADTHEEDQKKIVEESTTFKAVDMNALVPDASTFDKYVGQKASAILDDGYGECGHMASDNQLVLSFWNDDYIFDAEMEEVIDPATAEDLLDNGYIEQLTVKSTSFADFSNNIYEGMFD